MNRSSETVQWHQYGELLKQWMTLTIIIALAIFVIWLLILFIQKLFLSNKIKVTGKVKNKLRIILIWIYCAMFFFYSGWIINHFFLPHRFSPVSLVGDAWILLFTLFLGWGLMSQMGKKIIYAGATVFILGNFFLIVSIELNLSWRWLQPYRHIEISPIETLRSFPYATWTPTKEKRSGVTQYDPGLSYKGVNLYQSNNRPGGHILDMDGNVLHTFSDKREEKDSWKLLKPYQDSNFLVLSSSELYMIDWGSTSMKLITERCLHDVTYADNGDIYVIGMGNIRYLPRFRLMGPIRDDCLVIVMKNGVEKKKYP